MKNWPYPNEMLYGPSRNARISNIFLLEVMDELGCDTESDCFVELNVLLAFIAWYTSTLLLCLTLCFPLCHWLACPDAMRRSTNPPTSQRLWEGIPGHFEKLGQLQISLQV